MMTVILTIVLAGALLLVSLAAVCIAVEFGPEIWERLTKRWEDR